MNYYYPHLQLRKPRKREETSLAQARQRVTGTEGSLAPESMLSTTPNAASPGNATSQRQDPGQVLYLLRLKFPVCKVESRTHFMG